MHKHEIVHKLLLPVPTESREARANEEGQTAPRISHSTAQFKIQLPVFIRIPSILLCFRRFERAVSRNTTKIGCCALWSRRCNFILYLISCECAPRSDNIQLVPIHQHPTVLSWTARPVCPCVCVCTTRSHRIYICYLQLQLWATSVCDAIFTLFTLNSYLIAPLKRIV